MRLYLLFVLVLGIVLVGCTSFSSDPIVGCWTQTVSLGDATNSFQFNTDNTFIFYSWLGTYAGAWNNTGSNSYKLSFYDKSIGLPDYIVTYDPNQKLLMISNGYFMRTQCR